MVGSVNAPTPFGRSKKRSPSGRRTHFSILGSITDRDMEILLHLYEHKVLTTDQLHELHFSTVHRTRKRLSQLYERGLVDRFRPPQRPGSYPHHYVLDDLGAKLVAGYLGVELKELRFRKDRLLRLSRSRFLRHLRETNSFFSRLAYACRRAEDGTQLTLWLGERRATMAGIRPDGMGAVRHRWGSTSFWLELDLGTETHDRLESKLHGFARHMFSPEEAPHAVLFCFHSKERETRARRALYEPEGLMVATTTLWRHRADPLGPTWLPHRTGHRLSLVDLPVPERSELSTRYTKRNLVPREDDDGRVGSW